MTLRRTSLPPKELTSNRQSYLYQAVHREAVKVLMKKAAEKNKLTYNDVKMTQNYIVNTMTRLSVN